MSACLRTGRFEVLHRLILDELTAENGRMKLGEPRINIIY